MHCQTLGWISVTTPHRWDWIDEPSVADTYFKITETEEQGRTRKTQGTQVFCLETDGLYVVSADEIKMRYKNAHLKKMRLFYYNMTYIQCYAAYCFILSNIYKHIFVTCNMYYFLQKL